MKASDFNLKKDFIFDSENGVALFRDNRYVIFDTNAIGLLRQKLIDTIGWEQARIFFLQFGYQNGYSDFMQTKLNYVFDNEIELLASGPVMHTWEGIVKAEPHEVRFDRNKDEFYFSGTWRNSYEAEQHLSFNDIASEPVCWSLMGYASGWATAFFGSPLIALEPKCIGKGDENCEWLIQPASVWQEEADIYRSAYQQFFSGGAHGS